MALKELLLTTGYAGHDQVSFLAKLKHHHVEVVVDVRQNPVSRKKGFSQSKLSAFLTANNIEYLHESEFGVPVELRKQLQAGERDLGAYFNAFREYVTGRGGALDRLYGLATKRRCCLICLEHLAEHCHRSVVADVVRARNGHKLEVVHI